MFIEFCEVLDKLNFILGYALKIDKLVNFEDNIGNEIYRFVGIFDSEFAILVDEAGIQWHLSEQLVKEFEQRYPSKNYLVIIWLSKFVCLK